MKTYGKRLAAFLLASLLLSLIGCTREEGKEPESQSTAATQTQEPVKLTIAVPSTTAVTDYETNGYTLWLEEQTGYDLEFEIFQTGGEYKYEFDPLMEAEDLPDILWDYYADQDKWALYGAEGVLLDLAPYYNDRAGKARAFWDRLSELPEEEQTYVAAALTAEDGGMYAFPGIQYSMTDTMEYQVFINRAWLEKLELEMPDSPESLRTVLEAFRDGDPNGNGRKDELPMIGSISADSGDIVLWILNMFTPCSNTRCFNLDAQGQLYLPHTTDSYRRALIYIHDLIADGLMFPSAFYMSAKEIRSLVNPREGEPVTVGIWAGDPETIPEEGNAAIYSYEALPYWGGVIRKDQAFSVRVYISADCQNPDAAWNLLMLMCSEEGSLRMRYGVRGTDWAEDEGISFIGSSVGLRVLNDTAFSGPGNATWGDIHGTVFVKPEVTLQHDKTRDAWSEKQVELMTAGYFCFITAENASEDGLLLPRLAVTGGTPAEACRDLIYTALREFCCGTGTYKDPGDDAQWAAYLAKLEESGFDSWKESYWQAYRLQYPDTNS